MGGCDNYLNALKEGYTESLKIVTQAIKALQNIQNPQPHEDEDELNLTTQELQDQKEWSRQARLAKAMFAIDTDPQKGVVAGDSTNRLNFAIGDRY